jgi:hypothetical protein
MNRQKLHSQTVNCTPNFKKFFVFALDYCKANNKELVIHDQEAVSYGDDSSECSGWCDGDTIEIARGINLFEETFVHEFCHIIQADEECAAWALGQKSKIWEVLKCDDSVSVWKEIYKTVRMERDCERRVLKYNKTWNLFDQVLYTKQANAYLYFYHYLFLTRQWELSQELYCDKILDAMPSKLLSVEQLSCINMNIMALYDENLKQRV